MKWFWQITAAVAAGSLFVIALLFWSAWRASRFQPAADGAPLPSGIDVIAIQLDILSLIIAVVAIGLGVAGFVGYQSIREGAVRKAQEAAEAEIRDIAPPLIRREMEEFKRTFGKEDPISEEAASAMAAAAGEDGKDGGNGKK